MLRVAKQALEAKAPEELDAYRELVLDVAQSVAGAAAGGDGAEQQAIEKVRSAVS